MEFLAKREKVSATKETVRQIGAARYNDEY